ncbi:MAG: hypothetical protein ACLFVJ_23325, partial [Persicimonas sp.]
IEQDPYAKGVSVELETVEGALHYELNRRYREHAPDASMNDWQRDEAWLLKIVHAANVLEHVFDSVSGSTLKFRKTLHSPLMTEWILEHEPDRLKPIAELLNEVLVRPGTNPDSNLPN